MSSYQTFQSTRLTEPDPASLVSLLHAIDASIGVQHSIWSVYTLKKADPWAPAEIAAAQNAIDTAPTSTPELTAQSWVDRMPIAEKALLLTLLDEINRLRGWLVSFKAATAASTSLADLKTRIAGLPDMSDRTSAQAIQAVRDKAGTL